MRGSAARSLAPALAVLALVAVVAIAATGSTPVGTADGRPPSETLLDTFFSLALVLLVAAAAMVAYALLQRRAIAEEIASRRHRRSAFLTWVILASMFAVAAWLGYRGWNPLRRDAPTVDIGADRGRTYEPGEALSDEAAYRAEFAWVPVLIVVALAAIAVLAYVLSERGRRTARAEDATSPAERLADALDDTLDDLRAEPDPRRAVIAAFARLERTLGAAGVPRARSETADEYVARVLGLLDVPPDAVRRLTELFDRAKFSHHVIDEAMKEDAIRALERVRDELRLAARRQAAELDVAAGTPTGGAVTP
jgi:TRAP-type C4-dicarboxylate transport system permease small subunit